MEKQKKLVELRINVILLTMISAIVVVVLAVVFPEESTAVLAVAGSLVGSTGGVLRELCKPSEPDVEADPDPMVQIPKSSFEEMLAKP